MRWGGVRTKEDMWARENAESGDLCWSVVDVDAMKWSDDFSNGESVARIGNETGHRAASVNAAWAGMHVRKG